LKEGIQEAMHMISDPHFCFPSGALRKQLWKDGWFKPDPFFYAPWHEDPIEMDHCIA